jgi:copper transport protein
MTTVRAPRARLRLPSLVVGMFVAVVAMAIWASPAAAHAVLERTTPANEETLKTAPDRIELHFSEPIGVAFGGVKAFGPDGSRVDAGAAKAVDDTVTLQLDAKAAGTYAISWRVISADAHPVRGAFVFHVERASGGDVSRERAEQAAATSRGLQIAFGVARFVTFAGILFGAGGILFACLIAPGWRPRFVTPLLAAALVAAASAFVLDAATAGGFSLGETMRWSVLREQAGSIYGQGSLLRIGTAAVLLVLALTHFRGGPGWLRWACAVAGVAALASFTWSSHARSAEPLELRLAADALHVIAAGVWLGGLLQVAAGAVLGRTGALQRFSNTALGCVIVVVATGLYASWGEIGLSRDAALDTAYGRLVVAKILLLIAIMPLAWVNRRRNVPSSRGAGSERGLARYVRGEIGIAVVIVALTAWLVAVEPAKTALRPELVEKTLQLRDGTIQLVVDPAAAGRNEIHVYMFTESAQPDDEVTAFTLTAEHEKDDIGPLDLGLAKAGPGHYSVNGATIPRPGSWRFVAQITRGRFDSERKSFTVEIAGGGDQT